MPYKFLQIRIPATLPCDLRQGASSCLLHVTWALCIFVWTGMLSSWSFSCAFSTNRCVNLQYLLPFVTSNRSNNACWILRLQIYRALKQWSPEMSNLSSLLLPIDKMNPYLTSVPCSHERKACFFFFVLQGSWVSAVEKRGNIMSTPSNRWTLCILSVNAKHSPNGTFA